MTPEHFTAVLNRAADDVLEAVDAGDTGLRDVVNLVVNTAVHRLSSPDALLDDVIREEYGEEPSVVIGWCKE